METGIVHHVLKTAKVVATLKPDKPNVNPKSYRPIFLLSTMNKLLQRIIFNWITSKILEKIPVEPTLIECGYKRKLKTFVAVIDIMAADDTAWRESLITKRLRIIPCQKTANLLNELLNNTPFEIILRKTKSAQMKLNNGLPHGSVLAPFLFSLYIAGMPETESTNFGYAGIS